MSNASSPQNTEPQFWRTLEERAGTDEFRAAIEREFSIETPIWDDLPSRRRFLQSLGATLALAGLAGCVRRPDETIVPQVVTPEQRAAGQLQSFATAMPRRGGAMGLLVTAHEGRPIKIEGNPLHPASHGATDAIAQASILDLYDPDRSQVVRHQSEISYFGGFLSEFKDRIERHRRSRGAGLRLVTGRTTSPTLLAQLQSILNELPQTRWHINESLSEQHLLQATRTAFGREVAPVYHLDQADIIFSLDADLLGHGPDNLRLTREFAARRNPDSKGQMLRIYVAESSLSQTGAIADHRLPVSAAELPSLLLQLANRIGLKDVASGLPQRPSRIDDQWLNCVVSDLQRAGQRALVAVGPNQPPAVQLLGIALNARLGSLNSTFTVMPRNDLAGDIQARTMEDLVEAMQEKDVETLIVIDTNPCFGGPSSASFSDALKRVEWSAHCGGYFDETAEHCRWHVPTPHFLESWSDCRHRDGTAAVIQPLIAPLYNSQSPHHILDHVLHPSPRSAYDIVRDYWRQQHPTDDFPDFWGKSLHDGIISGSSWSPDKVELRDDWSTHLARDWPQVKTDSAPELLELAFKLDPLIGDGTFANNAWLQETPRPFTTQAWGNAAWLSPVDATRQNLTSGDVVELQAGDRTVRIPVIVQPGQAQGVCTVHLGYGRSRSGRHGTGVGVDVSSLQSVESPWLAMGVTLKPTGDRVALAITQPHQLMENRDLVRLTTWKDLHAAAGSAPHSSNEELDKHSESLYPEQAKPEGPQWGMVIDLNVCTGCNACVTACQAENNIPSVGAEQVRNGRRMHWLRVDTYYAGDPIAPIALHQPIMCMHCEHAPCEPVCPVAATTHSRDGLNEMTYNRCIGTRYCSNNCPYKVRRFNFLDYHHDLKSLPVLQLQPNPDVTVRSRGVMEKCTYCVQRIRRAGIAARVEGRELVDGDVVTACQAACPASAIVFGDITDAKSRVSTAKASPRNYSLLADLNTRPRTTYQAAVRNPHPDLAAFEGAS